MNYMFNHTSSQRVTASNRIGDRNRQKKGIKKASGSGIFSQGIPPSVSSALKRFTSVFGMGTGGAASL